MYSPTTVQARLDQLLRSPIGQTFVATYGGPPTPIPAEECQRMTRQLAPVLSPKGGHTRALTRDEQYFIYNERMLAKIDYQYFGERYSYIIHPAEGLRALFPLFESQRLILAAIGRKEEERAAIAHPDGILCNILKGRQLGASTLCQSILAHRVLFQTYTKGLIASDVPENSGSTGLFGMLELTVEHAPWWLKPAERFHTKNQHIVFANHASVVVESGKSMKGALQDEGGSKGQIGRSKTYSVAHLSECSTWENPGQIDDALMPAIPETPRTFMAKESTAKGRHNWWHKEWLASARGVGRSFNIFVPWYAERSKYWAPFPTGWVVPESVLQYAARVTAAAPQWMGQQYSLSKEQLYWYHLRRQAAEEKGTLFKFLEEFPAEPEEAFQYSGRSIFTAAQIDYLRQRAKAARWVYRVLPSSLIADLRSQTLSPREVEEELAADAVGAKGQEHEEVA
jgi:hypothetical protein